VGRKWRFVLAEAVIVDICIRGADDASTFPGSPEDAGVLPAAELETVARELLAPRREAPDSRSVPSAMELAGKLYWSIGTVYNRLRELRELSMIVDRLGPAGAAPLDRVLLTDALALAYPYLLLQVPDAS